MQETDEILYSRFLAEDRDEDLAVLMERYSERLTLFLYGFLHSMPDAQDLMLDTFAHVAARTARYSEGKGASFKTWLFAVARNLARTQLRRHWVNQVELRDGIEDERDTPENELLKEEQNRQLYQALDMINPDYRQVLYLSYFEDMEHEEIARVMKKTRKQIYNLASRGRIALREQLEKMGFVYEQY